MPGAAAAIHLTAYCDIGTNLAVNLTEGFSARLLPGFPGLLVETDLPPWLSFEARLPEGAAFATLDAGILATRDLDAVVFCRGVDDGVDGVARSVTLGLRPRVVAAPAGAGRQQMILLLNNPPARFILTRLRLIDPGRARIEAPA